MCDIKSFPVVVFSILLCTSILLKECNSQEVNENEEKPGFPKKLRPIFQVGVHFLKTFEKFRDSLEELSLDLSVIKYQAFPIPDVKNDVIPQKILVELENLVKYALLRNEKSYTTILGRLAKLQTINENSTAINGTEMDFGEENSLGSESVIDDYIIPLLSIASPTKNENSDSNTHVKSADFALSDICGSEPIPVALGVPKQCTKLETTNTTTVHVESKPVRIRTMEWCMSFPFKCSKYTTGLRNVTRNVTIEETRLVSSCCEGYEEVQNTCIPVCNPSCGDHLKCLAPNQCECEEGYGGVDCEVRYSPTRWGGSCENKCRCLHSLYCDENSGSCVCERGWTGENCDIKREPESTSQLTCWNGNSCKNNGICNHVTGECICDLGWKGRFCEEPADSFN